MSDNGGLTDRQRRVIPHPLASPSTEEASTSFRALLITRTEIKKSVIYRRKATGIRRVEKPDFQPEIGLIDATDKSHRMQSTESG